VKKDEQIAFLTKFKWIDKFATFPKILPLVALTPAGEKDTVTDMLDACSSDLIKVLKEQSKPAKSIMKQTIVHHMDELARTNVCQINKDFGYELFWYLGEKMGIDLKKSSQAKIWGYWKVESDTVMTVTSVRKKRTADQQV
jgi:hypothetical protein